MNAVETIVPTYTTILSGSFTKAGNFSGYDDKGERIHMHGKQVNQLGFKKDSDISFPIYCFINKRVFFNRDADGKESTENGTFERKQATAIFKDEDSLIHVLNAPRRMKIKAQKALELEAESSGYTIEKINSIVGMSL